MTVEALIFMTLGLLAVGLIIRAATSSSSRRKSDIVLNKHGSGNGNGNGHGLELDVITKELEVVPVRRDAAPTAELQAIGDIDAVQRAQTLVDKGQIIEAIRYLCDNAGFEMKKAVDMVDSMGKKVYPAD